MIVTRFIPLVVIAILALPLAACQTPAPSATGTTAITPTQQAVAGAASAAPGVVAVAAAAYPKALAAVNAGCPMVQDGLSILNSCLSGGAVGPNSALADANAIITPSCSAAGQLDLAANDTKAAVVGPTATNSGNSIAFMKGLLSKAAASAPVVCPIIKALAG